jgi:hypothetical protein
MATDTTPQGLLQRRTMSTDDQVCKTFDLSHHHNFPTSEEITIAVFCCLKLDATANLMIIWLGMG